MRSPRHATVVAYLALFCALSGSAVAVTKVGSKDIRKNAVRSKHIKNKAIKLADISPAARSALAGKKGAAGAAGPAGAMGPAGPAGPPGSSVSAANTVFVPASGTPAENGAALRAALTALPAATKSDPLAVQLGAGRYDLAGTGASVPADVTLAGAARDATIVESSPANVKLDVLDLGDRSGLHDLTVRTASSALGSVGVDGSAGRDNVLDRVRVEAGVGVVLTGGEIRDSVVTALGVTGVRVFNGDGQTVFQMHGSRVGALSNTDAKGLHASDFFEIHDSEINVVASNGDGEAVLFDGASGSHDIQNTTLGAAASGTARAVSLPGPPGGTATIEIDHSRLKATVALRVANGILKVGATQVNGTSVAGLDGQVRCAPNNYSGGMVAVDCDAP